MITIQAEQLKKRDILNKSFEKYTKMDILNSIKNKQQFMKC